MRLKNILDDWLTLGVALAVGLAAWLLYGRAWRVGYEANVPTEVGVAIGQVVHARKRFGVVGAELGFHKRPRLFAELEGLSVPAKAGVAIGQAEHASERFGVAGSTVPDVKRSGLFVLLGSDRCLTQVEK
jgi:hypothetical protein